MGRHVVVSLYGGLGNQLFQVAAGMRVAAELEATLWASREQTAGRDLLWRMLGEELPTAPKLLEIRAGGVPDDVGGTGRLALRAARTTGWSTGRRLAAGRVDEAFDPPPPRPPLTRVVAVNGIHQHPDWHAATAGPVADRLRAARTAAVRTEPGIVLHLRRGDYVKLGWSLRPEYYLRAVADLTGTDDDPDPGILIVSEDRLAGEGMARLLEAAGRRSEVAAPMTGQDAAIADFWRLVDADRLIMSNSTFCWWAAVTGADRPGRRVVFPAGWIGAGDDGPGSRDWTVLPSRTEREA